MKQTKHFKRTALSKSAKSMVSLMLLLIAMLMPQGAWATDFISEIKYAVHDKQETAYGYLSGYTIIKKELNNNENKTGEYWVYIGYKTDTDPSKAITDIMVVSGSSYLSGHLESDNSGNNYVTFTGDTRKWYRCPSQGKDGTTDINKGNGGDDLCIYYTRDGNTTNGKSAITTLDVAYETGVSGWTYAKLFKNSSITANGNTNEGTGGTDTYIVYKSHTHSYNNSATFNWASDGKTCTADINCTCGDKHTGIACTVTSVVKTPATCLLKGWTTYTAKVTYNGKNFSGTKDVQDIPLAEHTFNANGVCTRDASHLQEPELSSGYYQIANYGNLCWFRDKVNGGSYTINAKQTADITMPDGVTWGGIGHTTETTLAFKGTYDGNCHTISGLKISQDNTAFINTANKATIKNLGLLNVSVSGNACAGLVRMSSNSTNISNCYVIGSASYPLCNTNYGQSTITNCFANTGTYLVGVNYATITNCYTDGSKISQTNSGTESNCRTGVNAATFASGEITYLLNSGKTDGTQVWYQKLGTGGNALPTLVKNTSNTVYKLENLKCDGVTKNGSVSYSNSSQPNVDAHNWTNTTTYSLSAADCTHDAVYYKACSVCNAKGSETWTKTGTALGHSYGAGAWSWADDGHSATCTHTCSRDANHKSSVSVTLGNGITKQQTDPTCIKSGTILYTAKATVEGTTYSDTKNIEIEALGHAWATDFTIDAEPTCTTTGSKSKHCSRNGCTEKSDQQTLEMLSHDMTEHPAKDVTCGEAGNHLYYTCSQSCCSGKYYKDNGAHTTDVFTNGYIIPATGLHTFAANDDSQSECTVCHHGFFRYTSKNNAVISPTTRWGNLLAEDNSTLTILHNTNVNGNGVMEFNKPLVTIGEKVFEEKAFTGNLTIPNTVKTIGRMAFCHCTGFDGKLTIPNSVTSIGEHAFRESTYTGALTIPNSVTSIGVCAFYKCPKFTGDIVIPNSLTSIPSSLFGECSGFNGTLTIPNTITSIGSGAFSGCSGLTGNLIIPDNVTSIGDDAFENCSGLSGDLTISNSVKTIGPAAFKGCSGFTGSLTISNSITSLPQSVFENCSGLSGDLTIPNSVKSINFYAFQGCSNLNGKLTISSSAESIELLAFKNCSKITSVEMHSIPKISRNDVFYGMSCEMNVVLTGDSYLYKTENDGFPTVASVTAPCNLDLTGTAVAGHRNLTLNHGNEVVDAAVAATCTTTGLTEGSHCDLCHTVFVAQETIPATRNHNFAANDLTHDVCTVCNHGFLRYEAYVMHDHNNSDELRDKYGNTLTIESHTFSDDHGVMEFNAPLVTIGDGAFEGCRDFTKVTIPHTVSAIGQYAFGYINPDCKIILRSLPTLSSYYQTFFSTDINQEQISEITPTIELDDNSYVSSGFLGSYANNISYTRNNIKNQWGTIVVPFSVDCSGDDYDLYTLSSVSSDELTLTKVDGRLSAGTPALIRINSELVNGKTYDLTLTAASNAVNAQGTLEGTFADGLTLTGSYSVKDITDEQGYIISNNKFWSIQDIKGTNHVKCAPFRAYLAGTLSSGNSPQMLGISWSEGTLTSVSDAIEALNSDDTEIYDINGRRISSLRPGVNIVKYANGKTVKVHVK